MVAEPGVDPRTVLADGSATPLDVDREPDGPGRGGARRRGRGVRAGRTRRWRSPGSATAAAPHLVIALDTRGRSGIAVRLRAPRLDGSAADAVEPVALQYRVGESGEFANAPGGYVADATSGPGEADAGHRGADRPAGGGRRPAARAAPGDHDQCRRARRVGRRRRHRGERRGGRRPRDECGGGDPPPAPPLPPPSPPAGPAPRAGRARPGHPSSPTWSLRPTTFTPAQRGPAIVSRGRSGAGLRFRLSRAALVRFRVWGSGGWLR